MFLLDQSFIHSALIWLWSWFLLSCMVGMELVVFQTGWPFYDMVLLCYTHGILNYYYSGQGIDSVFLSTL